MNLVDANVILRFLTKDDLQKAERARILFELVEKGEIELLISDLVVAEVVWVLEKAYGCSRRDIKLKIEGILNTPNLQFQNRKILSECIAIYSDKNISFIDAYHVVLVRHSDIKTIFSYDTDFDKFSNIERKEP